MPGLTVVNNLTDTYLLLANPATITAGTEAVPALRILNRSITTPTLTCEGVITARGLGGNAISGTTAILGDEFGMSFTRNHAGYFLNALVTDAGALQRMTTDLGGIPLGWAGRYLFDTASGSMFWQTEDGENYTGPSPILTSKMRLARNGS